MSNTSPPRWTEDRVERLLVRYFAETRRPTLTAVRSDAASPPRRGSGWLTVALCAGVLAALSPVLFFRDSGGSTGSIARWTGQPLHLETSVDVAAVDADAEESLMSPADELSNEPSDDSDASEEAGDAASS